MKVLVIGCGSIGLRHMRNLKALGISDLSGFDTSQGARDRAETECGVRTFQSLDEALSLNPTLALICTPPHLHVSAALQAAAAGCHLFVEKPLANQMEGLDLLAREVRRRDLIALVGCNMRFHHGPASIKRLLEQQAIGTVISAILDAGQYMPDWHPELEYRDRYSARREMGGGVVLDGIHEIDYARWLFGEIDEVFAFGGKRSALDIDVEDVADTLMKFESGSAAMIHIDYVQPGDHRLGHSAAYAGTPRRPDSGRRSSHRKATISTRCTWTRCRICWSVCDSAIQPPSESRRRYASPSGH